MRRSHKKAPVLVLRNNKAMFLWGFAVVFTTMLALMTHVLVRDGAPKGYSPLFMTGVFLFFWCGALGLASWAMESCCTAVRVTADGNVHVLWRYPLRREQRWLDRQAVPAAAVFASTDDEGDPYFYARLTLGDGTIINLAEWHDREACEEICARFNAAVSGRASD
ncbi:MAG: hypothetical protein Q8J78_15500 [Moraxellaceae bacterium]|nr:hypothetical protein [Moraxellaceae bacterium]